MIPIAGVGLHPTSLFTSSPSAFRLNLHSPATDSESSASDTNLSHITVESSASAVMGDRDPAGSTQPTHARSTHHDNLARVLSCPHIIRNIISSSDRATQAVCLRVSRAFYDIAGPILYHTLTLGGHDAWSVIRGIIVNTDFALTFPLMHHLVNGTCTPPQLCGVSLANEHLELEMEAPPEVILRSIKPGGRRAHVLNTSKWDEKTIKGLAKLAYCFEVLLGSVNEKDEPYTTNFKTALLSHCKVLTIGSHHSCFCDMWGVVLSAAFRNVKCVRITPDRDPCSHLLPLCDYDPVFGCSLLREIEAEKVVFRNMDGHGFPLPMNAEWNLTKVREVVVILPTNGLCYLCGPLHFGDIETTYPNASLKIVWHDGWEGEPHPLQKFEHLTKHVPVSCEVVVPSFLTVMAVKLCTAPEGVCECGGYSIYKLRPGQFEVKRQLVIVGMGRLRFMKSGVLYNMFKIAHGGDLSPKQMLEYVREDIMTRKYTTAAVFGVPPIDPPRTFTDPLKAKTKFVGTSTYMNEVAGRRYELNAED